MAFDAGSVFATLGFKVNPAGAAKYEAMMSKATASASKSEAASAKAAVAAERSSAAMAAAGAKAAASVERLAIANQRAAIRVAESQKAMAIATQKYGAESTTAQKASLAHQEALRKQRIVSAELTAAQASLAASQNRHTAATSKGSAALTTLGSAAKTGAAAGLIAMGAAAIYSVRKSMDLQKALAEVQAVTRATPAAMAAYKKAAIDLGTSTGVGATKAANALAELAKGGLSVDDTLTALKGTIALAQAGGMDLADAGQTVAQSLNLFNMKGSEATKVADSFANAANATTADVAFFAQGMAQGGAAAKAAGLNFDQTTVALEMLAANGFKSGSDAGTSLKTTLTQIAHPTKQAAAEAKKLGLEFFNNKGQIKSVADISAMLGDKLGGLTKKQRLSAAATIAGTDGMRALLALYDQGPAKADKFAAANAKTGTASRTAADKTNNLEGNLQKLKAQFDALAISAGDTLVPALTEATKKATKFMQEMRTGKGTGGDFKTTVDDITGALKSVADSPVMGGIWDTFKSKVEGSGEAIGGIGKAIGGILTLDPGKFFDGLVQAAGGAAKQILAPFNALKDGIKDALGAGEAKPKVKPKASNTQMQNLDNAAVMAKAGGVAEFKVNAVLYNDGPVRERIAGIKALAAGVSLAKVQAVMSGDQPVRVRLAALAALAKHVPDALVQTILTGDGSVKLKLAALNASTKVPPAIVQAILNGDQSVKVKLAALKAIANGMPVADVMAIVNGDASVKRKLQAINALAGSMDPAKTNIFAFDNATPVINSALATLRGADGQSASMTITTYYKQQGYSPLTKNPPKGTNPNASGRPPGSSERALVGEGGGPEWIGNPADGFYRADHPTITDLRPQDAVIPTESRYAGNAIGFLRQMYGAEAARVAHEMGVSGYGTGRGAKTPAKKKKAKKPRYIPSHVYAKHSTDYYDGVVQNLEQRAGERTAKGNLTSGAKKARAALGKAKKERDAAHKYADQIATATGEADIFADEMQQADLRDDQGAYNTAYDGRKKQIQKAIDLLKVAVKLGPKGGAWAQAMRKQLSSLGVDVLQKPEDVVDKAPDPSTYTETEQKRLDELNRDEALAALTETTTDDIAAETAKRDWLQGILADAVRNPAARGGASAITAIAGELKSTTDSLANLTKAPDVSADLQAQIDQGKERERIANESAKNNAAVLAAFTGSGDIGAGGPNAYRAAGGVTVNFQSYVPPSPQEARRLADYTVGGIGYQGAPPSPRQVV